MAVFTLTLPDAQLPRLVLAVGQQTGQDTTAMNAAQKAAMVKQHIATFLKNVVQSSEVPAASAAAAATKIAEIEAGITVT